MANSEMVTVVAAASKLNVDARHVRRLLKIGKLRGAKHGRVWMVNSRSLATFQPRQGKDGKAYDYGRTAEPVAAFGKKKTVAEWARDSRCVVPETTLRWRLKNGWKPVKAITTPAEE